MHFPAFISRRLFQLKKIVMETNCARAERLQSMLFIGSRYENITGSNVDLSNLAADQNDTPGENLRKHEMQVN